jgi:DNA-binding transcriptional MocR family regulator
LDLPLTATSAYSKGVASSNGFLKPGQKLPSIATLTDQYECSQTQVKTAIAILRELGATMPAPV